MEEIIRQWWFIFAGALARQHSGRLPKRLTFGKLLGGEHPALDRPTQPWLNCSRRMTSKLLEPRTVKRTTTDESKQKFRIGTALWPKATKKKNGMPWHTGVAKGAERFVVAWHTEEKKDSRKRATKRDKEEAEATDDRTRKDKGEGESRGRKLRNFSHGTTTAVEEGKREEKETSGTACTRFTD